VLEPGMPKAAEALKKNNLPETEENLFIASSCEAKGIDFLLGKAKSSIRKKTDGAEKEAPISVKSGVTSVFGPRDYTISVDGRAYQVQVNAGGTAAADNSEKTRVSAPIAMQTSGIDIPAPTPGNIVRLEVEVGDTIAKEQTLLVMEAMKMESEVKSPQAGVVQAVYVKEGTTVQTGDALLSLRG